jgi:probable F420-dependent oxidoreductase
MGDPSHYFPLARTLEENGFDTFYIPDSICYPEEAIGEYPYNTDGTREFLDGVPFLEPLSLIPALAAITQRLEFTTFVVKLPIRHPTLVAKQVTTIGVITDNRFGFGVGLSPWVEDFAVTDTDWKTRGPRMDEMIQIIRGLGQGGYFEFHGTYYDLPRIKMTPVPSEPVPILIGGHAKAAFRRAARLGDGWIHAGGDFATYTQLLGLMDEQLAAHDRSREGFEIHAMCPELFSLDGMRRLRDTGATHAIFVTRDPYTQPDQPLEVKQDFIKRMADEIVSQLD